MNDVQAARRLEVAKQIVAVQRMYAASFTYEGEQRPSRGVHRTMVEAERAFADEHYDQAEHLTKVLTLMIKREAPKFAANPKQWIAQREELQT
jgi:hypothetical protein